MVLIVHVDTPEVWKMVTRLGTRSPVHCTATGLILILEKRQLRAKVKVIIGGAPVSRSYAEEIKGRRLRP